MYKTSLFAQVWLTAFFILYCMSTCSCEKTSDDVVEQGFMTYTFDWEKTLPGYPLPGTLRYCFYPSNNGAMIQMDSNNTQKLRFTLPPDQYQVIIFNCDTNAIPVRNLKKFDESEAFLPSVTKATEAVQAGRVPLYTVVIDTLVIAPAQDTEIRLTPEPLTRKIDVKVHVEGMEYVKECSGSLSGVITAINLSTRQIVPDSPTTVAFDTQRTAEGVRGNALVLGVIPSEPEEQLPPPSSNQVTLDFTLDNGNTISSSIDIGDQLQLADNQVPNLDVEIDASIQPGPTFKVVLNSWRVGPGDISVIE